MVISREVRQIKEWSAISAAAVISKEMPKRPVRKHLRMLNLVLKNTVEKKEALPARIGFSTGYILFSVQ